MYQCMKYVKIGISIILVGLAIFLNCCEVLIFHHIGQTTIDKDDIFCIQNEVA
jgi:hypothetical protein